MGKEAPRPVDYWSGKVKTLLLSEQGTQIEDLASAIQTIADGLDTAVVTPNIVPIPQAVNQLLNSGFIHSIASWNNSGALNDTRYECYGVFSNVEGEGVSMSTATAPTTPNQTLKQLTDGGYDASYCDWNWTNGVARFQGTKTIDFQLFGNPVEPSYAGAVTMQLVRATQYVYINQNTRLSCGLYGDSMSKALWGYLYGNFLPVATVLGTVATPTSRDYMVYARTNRGFTVSSTVITVANAPSNTDFNNGAVVNLSWKPVLNYGVIGYDIYRETAGAFDLLFRVVSGQTQYQDNGSITDTVVSYPAATFDHLVAYTATNGGALSVIPYSGDPNNPTWATMPFVIRVPSNYNKGDTVLTDFQWLRFGLFGLASNGNLDMRVTDGVADGSFTDITSAAAQFTAGQVGLPITITGKGIDDYVGVVDTYTSATKISVTPPYSTGGGTVDGLTVTIEGGAPEHSLWCKNVALSNTEGAAWAANPADYDGTHGIPPVTTNGSTQGGSGTGGGGIDGNQVCVFHEEWVQGKDGDKLMSELEIWEWIPDGHGGLNQVIEILDNVSDIFYTETENGVSAKTTDSHQFFTEEKEIPLKNLKKGDMLIVDGEPSPIKCIHKLPDKGMVRRISLRPGHSFLIGTGGKMLVSNEKMIDGPVS